MRKNIIFTAACLLTAGLMSQILLSGSVQAAKPGSLAVPCGDTAAFIAAINTANSTPEEDIVHLAAGCTFIFFQQYEAGESGGNALPGITTPVVLEGHGAALVRSDSEKVSNFRFFEVAEEGSLSLKRVTLRNGGGRQFSYGGAVLNKGMLAAYDSIFEGNSADQGGALYTLGKTQISGCLLHENTAERSGGALAAMISSPSGDPAPVIEITNTTITANKARYGYALALTGSAQIINSTIAGNLPVDSSADPKTAIALSNSPVVEIGNSILISGIYANCDGEINDLGGNVQSDVLPVCATSSIVAGDLLLNDLRDNGGPTSTMALSDGSPAAGIAVGVYCPPADQRGAARTNSAASCDAGAYETGGMVTSQITVNPDASKAGTLAEVNISLTYSMKEAVNALELVGALPDGLHIANLEGVVNTCDGTFRATPGEQNFTLVDGTLDPEEICELSFMISGNTPGQYVVSAGTITSAEGGTVTKNAEADFVIKTDTRAVLDCCDEPAAVGSPVGITVQVDPRTTSLAVPQGVVKCKIMGPQGDLYWIGELALVGGKAETWVQFDRPGPYLVDVMYGGSRIFNASPTVSQTLTVQHGVYIPVIRR